MFARESAANIKDNAMGNRVRVMLKCSISHARQSDGAKMMVSNGINEMVFYRVSVGVSYLSKGSLHI